MENTNSGNVERARAYAETASDRAKTTFEKSVALRVQALTWFTPGRTQDKPKAREMFSEAIQNLEEVEFMKTGFVANVYRDWIIMEALFGECAEGRRLFEEFWETVLEENYAFVVWQATEEDILINTSHSDCDVNLDF